MSIFRFDKVSNNISSNPGISSKSGKNTDLLSKLHDRLNPTLDNFELKKQLREELKKSFDNKGYFDDTENVKRIKNKLDMKASDYQALLTKIVNEVNTKTSASLHDKKFTKKEIETIIQSLRTKIEEKKKILNNLNSFDQYSTREKTSKIISKLKNSIQELENYMRHKDFKPKTLKEIKESIPEYKYFIYNKNTRPENRTHTTLKNVVASLTPHTSTGGTRRSKTRRSKTRRSKTRRSKTRKKSKKTSTK